MKKKNKYINGIPIINAEELNLKESIIPVSLYSSSNKKNQYFLPLSEIKTVNNKLNFSTEVKWDVSDLTTSSSLWLDSSTVDWKSGESQEYLTLNTIPNPNTVAQWDDRSGNSRHFLQVESTKQPSQFTSNNKRYVKFDGINDLLSSSYTPPSTATFISVYSYEDPVISDYYGLFTGTDGLNSGDICLIADGATGNMHTPNNGMTGPGVVIHVDGINQNLISKNDKLDIAVLINSANPWTPFNPVQIGADRNYVQQRSWKGRVAELILVTSAISIEERQKIEGYLAHKWGLTANLDVSHPYKLTYPVV